jgi:hypothetical protein
MDIHKPKPWRGIREFLKEYLIIVVGVLTALGFEQLAEHIRWALAVGEARASIHQEIAFNGGFFLARSRGRPCVANLFARLNTAVSAAESGGRTTAVPEVPYNLGLQISDAQWQAARAAQVLPHFPPGELAALGRYYDIVETFKTNFMPRESDDWLWLTDLKDAPRKLGPSDLAQLRFHIRSAAVHARSIGNISQELLDMSQRFGVRPSVRDLHSMEVLCAQPPPG